MIYGLCVWFGTRPSQDLTALVPCMGHRPNFLKESKKGPGPQGLEVQLHSCANWWEPSFIPIFLWFSNKILSALSPVPLSTRDTLSTYLQAAVITCIDYGFKTDWEFYQILRCLRRITNKSDSLLQKRHECNISYSMMTPKYIFQLVCVCGWSLIWAS